MDRVTVGLESCYGIKRLDHTFDFSKKGAYALYAPNGTMKSSLARTFQDVAEGKKSSDRIFQGRTTIRKITDESGSEVKSEQVLVVLPYDPDLRSDEKTAVLLLDAELKAEYAKLYREIDKAKAALLEAIAGQSGSKRDFSAEISSAFTSSANEFTTALQRIKTELGNMTDTPLAGVEYEKIFDEKVLSALQAKNARAAIQEYVRRYNDLLAASTFFKKGTFDYYNAGQIAASLASNGFFSAKHTVRLNANGHSLEINNQKELEDVISKEKETILKDAQLRKKFDEIAKQFDKNVTVREFRKYISDHEPYLARLDNIDKFREDILKSYLRANYDLYLDLMQKTEAAEVREKEINEAAASQRTQWEEVIEIFNERFVVPFKLEAKNRIQVMTGQAQIIELGFTYHDGDESVAIGRAPLMDALSNGEKKALYVLNVIFEVEARKKNGQETIVIVDDIADSFDYQNKYAIIQYLKDISESGLFKQLIMTHNFDFFRTVVTRFVGYGHGLMASKDTSNHLALTRASGIRNVFANDWKEQFYTDPKKKLACIPFLRNLVEYTEGDKDPKYVQLTSVLHWKPDTVSMTVSDLDQVYNSICKRSGKSAAPKRHVYDLLIEQAKSCMTAPAGTNFENKIVLSMAIRLATERFLAEKINDPAFLAGIGDNQSYALVRDSASSFQETLRPAWS